MSTEAKKANKPTGSIENEKVAQGLENPPATSEVAGHMSPGAFYNCWHCGVVNWVPFGWNYFYCRFDHVLNRV